MSYLLLAGILIALFGKLLLPGQTLFYGDVAVQYYPWALLLSSYLRQGDLPLWVSELGCGFPLAAASEPGVFYPLQLLSFTLLPPEGAFDLMVILHLWIIGAATYGFLRLTGAPGTTSLLGACCFMLGGASMGRVFHTSVLRSMAWLPVGFLCLELYRGGFREGLLLAGAAMGMSWLAGHPQIAAYVAVAILSYALYTTRRIGPVLLVGLIGGGLSAIQWCPTLELIRFSERAHSMPTSWALDFSFHPRNLITLLFPGFFGFQTPAGGEFWGKGNFWELSVYTGVLPVFFAIAAWRRRRIHPAGFFLAMMGVSFLFMLGKYGGLLQLLQWCPLFNRFKNPERWGILFCFSLSVLAAWGWQGLREDASLRAWIWRASKKVLGICSGIVGVLFLLFGLGRSLLLSGLIRFYAFLEAKEKLSHPLEHYRNKFERSFDQLGRFVDPRNLDFFWSAFLLLAAGFLLWKLVRAARPRSILAAAFTLVLIDLGVFASRCIPIRALPDVTQPPGWLVPLRQAAPEGGFLLTVSMREDHSREALQSFTLMPAAYGIHLANPPGPLGIASNAAWVEKVQGDVKDGTLDDSDLLNQMGVRYLLTQSPIQGSQLKLLRSEPYPLYENQSAQPSLSLEGGSLEYTSWTATRQSVRVTLKEPNDLTFRQRAYPGWVVAVDEKIVPVRRVDEFFRSVAIPAGQHTVEFEYRPLSVRLGAGITWATALLLLMGVALGLKNKLLSAGARVC